MNPTSRTRLEVNTSGGPQEAHRDSYHGSNYAGSKYPSRPVTRANGCCKCFSEWQSTRRYVYVSPGRIGLRKHNQVL